MPEVQEAARAVSPQIVLCRLSAVVSEPRAAVSNSHSSLSRAGHRLCGASSGKASAIIASTVAIALVLPIRRDERVIAFCLIVHLLTIGWREGGRIKKATARVRCQRLPSAAHGRKGTLPETSNPLPSRLSLSTWIAHMGLAWAS
jgi:hypothetical protein